MTFSDVLQHRLTWSLVAGLITLIGAYFAFSRDILKELHFLKGQNSLLLHRFQLLDKIHEKAIGLDKDQSKVRYDLDNAWSAIRELKQGGRANGSIHQGP